MTTGPDGDPKETRVQMNVRVPEQLRERIDARREPLGLSRDEWVTRALSWALEQPPRPVSRETSVRTTTGRTLTRSRKARP